MIILSFCSNKMEVIIIIKNHPKKIAALLICCVMVLGLLTGCKQKTAECMIEITNATEYPLTGVEVYVYECEDPHELVGEGDSLAPGEHRTFSVTVSEKELESENWLYAFDRPDNEHSYTGQFEGISPDAVSAFEIVEDSEIQSMFLAPVE